MYAKVLAVRDAMLQTFCTLQPAEEQQQRRQLQQLLQAEQQQRQQQAAEADTALAAQGLALALDQLPSDVEINAAEPDTPTSDPADIAAQPGASDSATAGPGDSDTASGVPEVQAAGPPQFLLGEAHRTGTADSLDGSALQGVELIPPPTNSALKQRICSWQGPEDLVRDRQRLAGAAADAACSLRRLGAVLMLQPCGAEADAHPAWPPGPPSPAARWSSGASGSWRLVPRTGRRTPRAGTLPRSSGLRPAWRE